MSRLHRMQRPHRLRSGVDNAEDERLCWICLTTDDELPRSDWLHPCRCRGTNKWVHEMCLSRWIDEKQLNDPDMPVACTQCRTEYIIVMPPLCRFDALLESVDKTYERICPSAVMGMLAATVYFSAVTYGALTLIQVAGYEVSMQFMQDDPTLLMIVLPAVPTVLLLSRLIHWEDRVGRWLRRRQHNVVPHEQRDAQGNPLPGAPLDDDYFEEQEREYPTSDILQVNSMGTEQIMRAACGFCTALGLPTFAVAIAQTLYGNVQNRLLSVLLGGLTFLAAKGATSIYLRQSKYHRKRKRYVLDNAQDNLWFPQRMPR